MNINISLIFLLFYIFFCPYLSIFFFCPYLISQIKESDPSQSQLSTLFKSFPPSSAYSSSSSSHSQITSPSQASSSSSSFSHGQITSPSRVPQASKPTSTNLHQPTSIDLCRQHQSTSIKTHSHRPISTDLHY